MSKLPYSQQIYQNTSMKLEDKMSKHVAVSVESVGEILIIEYLNRKTENYIPLHYGLSRELRNVE